MLSNTWNRIASGACRVIPRTMWVLAVSAWLIASGCSSEGNSAPPGEAETGGLVEIDPGTSRGPVLKVETPGGKGPKFPRGTP